MANVQINWTAYSVDPNDVDFVDLYRSTTLDSEQEFQAAIDAGSVGTALTSISDITSVESFTDTTAVSGATYYYCLAARNAGGSTVGTRGTDDTTPLTAVPTAGNTAGAVACVAL